MQSQKHNQHIVLKGFIIFFCAFLHVSGSAQSIPLPAPEISGTQLLQDLQDGSLTIEDAVSALDAELALEAPEIEELITTLQDATKIDLESAGTLIDGFISEDLENTLDTFSSVKDMVDNIENGTLEAEVIDNLVDAVGLGDLPAEIGEILSTFEDLGNITSLADLQDIFNNPDIVGQLDDLLNASGIVADVNQIIGTITEIALTPQALVDLGAQAISDAINSAISSVSSALADAIGSQLTGVISGVIGAFIPGLSSCKAQCSEPCSDCAPRITLNHERIRAHVTYEFMQHRNWFVSDFFTKNILPALARMTAELTTTGMLQIQAIGSFFDAKHQLETQRIFQTMASQAHKDYHPSEGLCTIGTNVRSLAASQKRSDLAHRTIARHMMDRQLLTADVASAAGDKSDRLSRLDLFVRKHCNPQNHGGGLQKLCEGQGQNPEQINMDIDFTNAVENKLTLELDYSDSGAADATTDEENIFALASFLFANEVLPDISDDNMVFPNGDLKDNANLYFDIRAVAAKRSVAQNSFAAITAMKAQGDGEAGPFLKAILSEAGIDPQDIEDRLGANPSYFAQMEVLTKDLYQNPTFYANLYDKPVNIERKATALLAIEIMQDRDIYESLLRSEAVLATLIEVMIQKEHDRVTNNLNDVDIFRPAMGNVQ